MVVKSCGVGRDVWININVTSESTISKSAFEMWDVNNFTPPSVIATRDVQIVMLVRYDDGYLLTTSHVGQGAGRPFTGSTGTTVSILLGWDSEARELRAELGGHSFIPRIDRPRSQRTT